MEGRLHRAGLVICLLVFSAVIIRYGILPALNNTKGDFPNYYIASRLLADGISLEPAYRDFIWFQQQMDRYGITDQAGGFIPHPPSTALVLLPLTGFSPVMANNIWLLINILLVIADIILLARIARLPVLLTAVLFLGSGYALLNNLLFGQQYLPLLTTILLALYLHQKKRPIWAGLALGSFIPVKYVGILFMVYFAWLKEWRLVGAAAATAGGILLATLWFGGMEVFQSFITEVFPRHLRGEAQAPYAINFQSWNSLFRNLFLYHETLNINPVWPSPVLFVVLKNIIMTGLLIGSLFVLARIKCPSHTSLFLFHIGFILTAFLVNSPASVTYHFLLLTPASVFFVKLLLDEDRHRAALLIAGLFILVNLPLFPRLLPLAQGPLLPLAYPRLWLMSGLFIGTIYLFRRHIAWRPFSRVRWGLPVIAVFTIFTTLGFRGLSTGPADQAVHWPLKEPVQAILKQPAAGTNRLVFTALVDDRYAVYTSDQGRWSPPHAINFYNPALAADDSTLLVETVGEGRLEIWLSRAPGQSPTFLQVGQSPVWHPDGRRFAFYRDEHLYLTATDQIQPVHLLAAENAYDLAFSPDGEHLAYCVQDAGGTRLNVLNIDSGRVTSALESSRRIATPAWSPDGTRLFFTWNKSGNRDIWSTAPNGAAPVQHTFHRDADADPVWFGNQLIFATDRGRGLEMSTLYRLHPGDLP